MKLRAPVSSDFLLLSAVVAVVIATYYIGALMVLHGRPVVAVTIPTYMTVWR